MYSTVIFNNQNRFIITSVLLQHPLARIYFNVQVVICSTLVGIRHVPTQVNMPTQVNASNGLGLQGQPESVGSLLHHKISCSNIPYSKLLIWFVHTYNS